MISVLYTLLGVFLPFFGTAIGAAAVFIFTKRLSSYEKIMSAFAAGVMTAASVWSLIIPAIKMCNSLGRLAFSPVLVGAFVGSVVMVLCEKGYNKNESATRTGKQFAAVTLHNLPEGMAVGLMFSRYLSDGTDSALIGAFAFSLAIAIQNIPEGAIISLPDYTERKSKSRAFGIGVLSGAVEPLGAVLTLLVAGFAEKALPYLFGFAAGTMLYVIADGLLDRDEERPTAVPLCFIVGFSLMMTLDVALG